MIQKMRTAGFIAGKILIVLAVAFWSAALALAEDPTRQELLEQGPGFVPAFQLLAFDGAQGAFDNDLHTGRRLVGRERVIHADAGNTSTIELLRWIDLSSRVCSQDIALVRHQSIAHLFVAWANITDHEAGVRWKTAIPASGVCAWRPRHAWIERRAHEEEVARHL